MRSITRSYTPNTTNEDIAIELVMGVILFPGVWVFLNPWDSLLWPNTTSLSEVAIESCTDRDSDFRFLSRSFNALLPEVPSTPWF